MIPRQAHKAVTAALGRQAAVALIGPRKVGKTTLARNIVQNAGGLYLDLEAASDRAKLADARLFLDEYEDRLVVLDEIHRAPGCSRNCAASSTGAGSAATGPAVS